MSISMSRCLLVDGCLDTYTLSPSERVEVKCQFVTSRRIILFIRLSRAVSISTSQISDRGGNCAGSEMMVVLMVGGRVISEGRVPSDETDFQLCVTRA